MTRNHQNLTTTAADGYIISDGITPPPNAFSSSVQGQRIMIKLKGPTTKQVGSVNGFHRVIKQTIGLAINSSKTEGTPTTDYTIETLSASGILQKGVKIDEWGKNGYSERELPVRQPELNEEGVEMSRAASTWKRKLWPVRDFGKDNGFEEQY
ncbi:hypothetical protein CEXT_532981 [Caerostris extrusa]|uniref:Uncharacterized protein n=1 Tax=Caerostris extrusa TaxID=172846 RepID=A0AAV4PKV3_CAEEX|nr:hypothetical protein CEXT_532981 [Caerostris extrusa]